MSAIQLNGPASSSTAPSLQPTAVPSAADQDQLFTCLSCSVAFLSPDEQRDHMKSDWHRYNMKRRVATLPPVTAAVFNRKVIERRNENAVTATKQGETCHLCSKSFASQGAYRTHVESKKHRDQEVKEATRLLRGALLSTQQAAAAPAASADEKETEEKEQEEDVAKDFDMVESAPVSTRSHVPFVQPTTTSLIPSYDSYAPSASTSAAAPSLSVPEDATEDDVLSSIDAKIAFARTRLTPTSCLFCSHTAGTIEDSVDHMQKTHGFFIPDREYLSDIQGLILYLSEKVAIGNVCLYCNGKGKEWKTMDAVRKHMIDKSHCKLAYSTEAARLEFSDYYDFSSSYPDAASHSVRKGKRASKKSIKSLAPLAEDEDWEDDEEMDVDAADEVVEVEGSASSDADSDSSFDSDDEAAQGTYVDPESLELVLPSGRRIGHRSLSRYYTQRPTEARVAEVQDAAALTARRKRIGQGDAAHEALVARKGGFGGFGQGGDVVKARNRGEARKATKNPFREMQKREQFKTRTGFIHNSQKHFRDPLLQ